MPKVVEITPIPVRPDGFFTFDDELSRLADRASPSYPPGEEYGEKGQPPVLD